MINRIVLTGRLVDDPEGRHSNDGMELAKFRIAVDRVRKGREGDPDADFFNVVAFGRTAEFVNKYLKRGDLVGVDGRLHQNPYEDRDGNRRVWVEVSADNVQSLARADSGGGGGGRRDGGGRDRDQNDDFPDEEPSGSRGRDRGRDDDRDRDRDRSEPPPRREADRDESPRRGPDREESQPPKSRSFGGGGSFENDDDDPFAEE